MDKQEATIAVGMNHGYTLRQRISWAVVALIVGVVIAGFWNYKLVDGFGKEMVAGPLIGDTQSLAGTFQENGWDFGFLYAAVAGLAATFTACNCVVFAMMPGIACASNVSARKSLIWTTLAVFTFAVVVVNFFYGLVVGSFESGAMQVYNEREVRIWQAQITFTILGVIMLIWGTIAFGFADRFLGMLPMRFRLIMGDTVTKAGMMGMLVGFFSVGRPFPVFRDFLTYMASAHHPLYGALTMAVQGLAQVAVMLILLVTVHAFFGKQLSRWAANHPSRMELLGAFAMLAGGAYFVYYWGLSFAFDIGRWGFKLDWYG